MIADLILIAQAFGLIVVRSLPGIVVILVAALVYGAVRFHQAGGHRAGVARVARHEARSTAARRERARTARWTVIDAETGAVTVERPARRTV